MWPPRRPARGSGASPRKRSAARASTTCAVLSSSTFCTSSIDATMARLSRGVNVFAERGFAAPVSSGRFSAFHFGMPPSSTRTLSDAEGAERQPHARRAVEPDAVIENDRHAVADAELADLAGELLGRGQHVGQGIGMVRDRVDVEALSARDMAGEEFALGVALVVRQIVRAIQHDDVRIAEMLPRANPSRPASGWRAFLPASSVLLDHANEIRTRRFCLPFFSICVTRIGPISPVRRTCVPPQGCRSKPDDLDQPHAAAAHRRLDRHGLHQPRIGLELRVGDPARRTSASAAIISFTRRVISSLSSPASGMSKSSRLSSSFTAPPVTG